MRRRLLLLWLCVLWGCTRGPTTAAPDAAANDGGSAPRWDYTLSWDGGHAAQVDLCFPGVVPRQLTVASPKVTTRPITDAGPVRDTDNPKVVDLPPLRPGQCVHWDVDLPALRSRAGRGRSGGFISDPEDWLWRPGRLADGLHATLRTKFGPGLHLHNPWPALGEDHYALDVTCFRWQSWVTFATREPLRFRAAEARFDVTVLGAAAAPPEEIEAWLRAAAETIGLMYGRYPRERVQVTIVAIDGWGSGPVHFGATGRGGGPGILLLLDKDAREVELRGEWVAIHELFHLTHPFVPLRDRWFSEGLATYYTSVLRTRAGFRDVDTGWSRVVEQLQRHPSGSGRSLAEMSANLYRDASFQKVYWGGAAVALLVDLHLREHGASLDAVARHLAECCTSARRTQRAGDLLALASRAVGVPSAARVAKKAVAQPGFPELSAAWDALGVSKSDGSLHPQSGAKSRAAIMAPPAQVPGMTAGLSRFQFADEPATMHRTSAAPAG